MATLHDTLARRMKKATSRPRFTPEGWPTVTPRIFARDAKRLVAFIRKVFGATGTYRQDRPTELRIGGSILMINDTSARGPAPAFLYVYVPNVDAAYRRAVAAGARPIEEPGDLPYGDRRGMVEDRWGNTWQIATRIR
jgi:PhnB protein